MPRGRYRPLAANFVDYADDDDEFADEDEDEELAEDAATIDGQSTTESVVVDLNEGLAEDDDDEEEDVYYSLGQAGNYRQNYSCTQMQREQDWRVASGDAQQQGQRQAAPLNCKPMSTTTTTMTTNAASNNFQIGNDAGTLGTTKDVDNFGYDYQQHHNYHHHHRHHHQQQQRKPRKQKATRCKSGGGGGGGFECISRRYFMAVGLLVVLGIFLSCQLLQSGIAFHEYSYSTTNLERSQYGLESTNNRIINESLVICAEEYTDTRRYVQNEPRSVFADLPIIYFVTPTYPRREQIPELTRLAHTLLHVARLHWIVANDHPACNLYLDSLLNKFGIPYTHLASPMPTKFRSRKPAPRGVANRRAALQWLRQHNITSGILYFGDDDNTYDLKLFSEIRTTQRVSMFPVGLIADYSISAPVVRNGKVVGFLDSWVADRHWPVDMAGFAVNIAYMAEYPNAGMPYKPGYEEDYFLRSVGLRMDFIEPKGNNCTEVLVWHTQTKSKSTSVVRINDEYLDKRSNLGALFRQLEMMGVARATNNEGPNVIISKNGKPKPHSTFLS